MFIVVEGIEGSGKSTLINGLARVLAANIKSANLPSREILVTKEPGGTALGLSLRELLLHRGASVNPIAISPLAELFLFCADRAQHVNDVISPALARGAIVLCDRYIYSTYAYQGHGRGLDLSLLQDVSSLATGGLLPDIVLLLDLEPEQALDRARARSLSGSKPEVTSSWTRFEAEEISFHQRIRAGFLEMADKDPTRFHILAAKDEQEKILASAIDAIHLRFGKDEHA